MPINDFPREATTPNGIPDLPSFEAVVGDVLNFTPLATIGASTVTLVQKPAGSTATVASGAFTCDLAGVYLVTLANAGFTRAWTVYCFAAASVTAKVTRTHLRGLAAGAGTLGTAQTSALRTTLEGASPTNLGVNFAVYGN
jgi:hypothetical protein